MASQLLPCNATGRSNRLCNHNQNPCPRFCLRSPCTVYETFMNKSIILKKKKSPTNANISVMMIRMQTEPIPVTAHTSTITNTCRIDKEA